MTFTKTHCVDELEKRAATKLDLQDSRGEFDIVARSVHVNHGPDLQNILRFTIRFRQCKVGLR